MDASTPDLSAYTSLPSSIAPAAGNAQTIVDNYLIQYPLADDKQNASTGQGPSPLSQVITKLQNGVKLNADDWIIRAKHFISADLPDLAAFDAHKAYLLSDGEYDGMPLKEEIDGEEHSEEKDKVALVMSRALLLAGCYAESFLFIQFKAASSFHGPHDPNDPYYDDARHMQALFDASQEALEAATVQYHGTSVNGSDAEGSLAPPALRDGSVHVTQYSLIPQALFLGPNTPTTRSALNHDILCGVAPNATRVQQTAATHNSSSTGNFSPGVQRLGIFALRKLSPNERLIQETNTTDAVKLYDTGHSDCKYCHQSIPDKGYPYRAGHRFCNDECDRKFSRFVRVPEDLLADYLRLAVDFWSRTGQHPLLCPEIDRLSADYGNTISLSYDRHIAKAINVLQEEGIKVFSDSPFDGAVVMNILARLQNNAFAFDVDVTEDPEDARAAVFPISGLINVGEVANVVVKCVAGGRGFDGEVTVRAIGEINEGEELLLGPA